MATLSKAVSEVKSEFESKLKAWTDGRNEVLTEIEAVNALIEGDKENLEKAVTEDNAEDYAAAESALHLHEARLRFLDKRLAALGDMCITPDEQDSMTNIIRDEISSLEAKEKEEAAKIVNTLKENHEKAEAAFAANRAVFGALLKAVPFEKRLEPNKSISYDSNAYSKVMRELHEWLRGYGV